MMNEYEVEDIQIWRDLYYQEKEKNKKLELETIPLLEGEIKAYKEK